MTKYEDVKNQTTEEYFNNNVFSIDVFNTKYRMYDTETYVQAIKRVCDYIASAEETTELQKYWSEKWFDEIYNDYWKPAGSIMQGSDNPNKISLMNCTAIAMPEDSLESIFRYNAYQVAKTAAYRQGLGIDFSVLRPKGMKLNNSANISEGAIHWMKFIDSIGYFVGQKGRIPAMLFSLSITHLDIEEFITVKSDYTTIQNANISVQISNKFYETVLSDENADWSLEFTVNEIKKGDKLYINEVYDDIRLATGKDEKGYYLISKFNRKREHVVKKIKAKYLMELIAKNMFANADPGIQNIDIARKYSNSDAVGFPIIATNACSEQYLDKNGNCDLASYNLIKYFDKDNSYNKELLKKECISVVRFLDNVVTMEIKDGRYATYEQLVSLESLRRIGGGVTNIVGLLLLNGIEYGSKESNKLMENLMDDICYYSYQSSGELGKEKGSFKAFTKEKYLKSGFIKQFSKRHPDLTFDYQRNVCLVSIAPTGSLSTQFRNLVISYGIEPSFGMFYWKRTRISGKYEYYFCVPQLLIDIFNEHGIKLPIQSETIKDTWDGKYGKPVVDLINKHLPEMNIKFKSSIEISALDKLDLMSKVQKSVDSSISVTYTLPEKTEWTEVYDFIIEAYKKEVKSIAAFPDRKMYGIVSFIPFKELAFKLKAENIKMHPQNFTQEELNELNISVEEIPTNVQAPKRLKELDADIYSVSVKGVKYCMAVGLQNNKPYELFGGLMNGLAFKFSYKKGKIIKVSKGKYKLEIGDDIVVEDFQEQFTPVEQMFFRLISTNLRHGVPIKYIVDQLQKSSDDITSLTSAAARVLKKYIQNGESGGTCPVCKEKSLIYENGCFTCANCGYGKCG